MKKTKISPSLAVGTGIRIDYLFSKKDYSFFINNLSTLHKLLDENAFSICVPFELKSTEVDVKYPFPTYKYQFPQKTSGVLSMISPDTLDGLEYSTEKKSENAYVGISNYGYSKSEHYLAAKVFQETFLLNPEHENIERMLELLSYCKEEEISFIKKNLIKDKKNILDLFGESAYNFLLKLFSYIPPKEGFSTEIIRKKHYTKNIKKNIFAKNNKFLVAAKLKFFSSAPASVKGTEENYYKIFGNNRIRPSGKDWSRMSFNIYFSKKTRSVTAIAFIYKESLPKNQTEVESLMKDLDIMVCETMNYYNNMLAIYYYLIKVFKGEILINQL